MISIITPTYNSEKYLEKCILSILQQGCCEYEHIIVDGGSTDGTLSIIRKYEKLYPMKWISEKDNGMYDAIAKGFKLASGDIFCWLNSDDMYMPWTLRAVQIAMNHKDVKWIMGMPSNFNAEGICYLPLGEPIPISRWFIRKGWMENRKLWSIQQESSFWKRELYEQVGGLDQQYKLAGDYHLWKKFADVADLYMVDSVLAGFRIHEGQLSGNIEEYRAEIGKLSRIQAFMSKYNLYKKTYSFSLKLKRLFCGKKSLKCKIIRIERK